MNIIDTCKENRIVRTSVKMYIELFDPYTLHLPKGTKLALKYR